VENFRLPLYGLGDPFGNSLDEPENDPFDIFADPFETMFDPFDPGAALRPDPFELAEQEIEGKFADNVGGNFDHLEKSVENTPPIKPKYETDGFDSIFDQHEKSVEGTEIPPAPDTKVKLYHDPGWGYPTPTLNGPSPPQGLYDYPSTSPKKNTGPIGRRRGKTKDTYTADEENWCPFEGDFISRKECEKKNCKYFDRDINECRYGEENQGGIKGMNDVIGTEDQMWCPLEGDYINRQVCKNKKCEYYEIGECFYDNKKP